MATEEEARHELAMILDSLKGHILWSREQGRPLPFLYRGNKEQISPIEDEEARPLRSENSSGIMLSLDEVRSELGDCRRCLLGSTRTNLVFGEGDPEAELVFVGEAPGGDEDRQGRAFRGKGGPPLTKI